MKTVAWLCALCSVAVALIGCDSSDDGGDDAEIVGCDRVDYQGYTFTVTGCRQGVSSFDARVTQVDAGGQTHQAAFHITCAGNCIDTATPIEW